MSLSNTGAPKLLTGKVLLGGAIGGRADEVSLAQIEGSRGRRLWDEAMEAEYLERVKVRAAEHAKEILQKAQRDADAQRAQGYGQGYADGIEKAVLELEAERREMAEKLGRALGSVHQGCRDIWARHREDVLLLVRLTVEKALGIELTARRRDILASLMDEALDSLDNQRGLTLRVHPADAETTQELLNLARDKFPTLEAWRVKPDADMVPGGLVIEADQGRVDNSLETRMAAIAEVLDNLEIPDDEAASPDPLADNAAPQAVP